MKMRTLIVVVFAIVFAGSSMSSRAQERSYDVTLVPTGTVTPLPRDVVCPYFLLSNLGYLPHREVSFQYRSAQGATESDVIAYGRGEISIEGSGAVPSVKKTANGYGNAHWLIIISQSAYNANAACLGGLPQK
jgi:hypothetical protein